MNILIAIGGRDYSKPTLDLGMKVANSLEASTTIAYVGKKVSQFSEKDVSVVHQNLDERQLYRPGVRTLEWAYDFLNSKNYIQEEKNDFNDHLLVDEENSRMRVLLKGKHSNKIDLILRTGEIIEQLRLEVQTNNHDITIIGGGSNKGMHHDLVQFIDSSVLVVKNYSLKKEYKILLPVNNSIGSNNAIEIAEQFAKAKGSTALYGLATAPPEPGLVLEHGPASSSMLRAGCADHCRPHQATLASLGCPTAS